MPGILLDTWIYVAALRRGNGDALAVRYLGPNTPLWLSAVVLEELYAGAAAEDTKIVERLERDFRKADRVAVPSLDDWTQAGKTLARFGARYGYEHIGKARLTNDALIAVNAGRLGFTFLTSNARDFARPAGFRHFRWEVAAFS